MAKFKVRPHTWVVVCDGRKAIILENDGDERALNLRVRELREHPDPATHELGAQKPGRMQPSVGTARSAVEQTDWHARAEHAFLASLGHDLHLAAVRGAMKDLIVIAAPRALGVLRETYSPLVRQALLTEIDKDLVKLPTHEIEKHLVG